VFDASASIYRFNGYDQRLTRSLESALLVFESAANIKDVEFEVRCHHGDAPDTLLADFGACPSNEKVGKRPNTCGSGVDYGTRIVTNGISLAKVKF